MLQFVATLLLEAVATNQSSPSEACVSWMCSEWLEWVVWRLEDVVVWAYHSPLRPIPAWAQCFSAREEESGDQWSHQVGLISRVNNHRLVFIPSTVCQDQVSQSVSHLPSHFWCSGPRFLAGSGEGCHQQFPFSPTSR